MANNILKYYFSEINKIINQVKKKNIYKINLIQHYLWNEFCEKNIPFLIILSNYIAKQLQNKDIDNILFTTRDCVFLKKIFDKLYPNTKSETFYASRALYLFPPPDYLKYCNDILTDNTLVVDFQGTGQSFMTLISKLKIEPWYLLVNWNSRDKLQYSTIYLNNYHKKIIIREKNFFDDAIEKLNIDLVGTYFDFKNNKAIPYVYEYDTQVMCAFHKCFDVFINSINDYNIKLIKEYQWDNNFNEWMDRYYTNSATINDMKWIHTHFQYDANNINSIRKEYSDAKND